MSGKKSLQQPNIEFMRNHRAEQEVLGVVIWLIANDHDKHAEEVIDLLRPLPEDLFFSHQHRSIFNILSSLDTPETRSLSYIETRAKQNKCWSDDPSDKHDISSEYLHELSEKGDLTLTLKTKAYTPIEFVSEVLEILERHCIERRVHTKRTYFSEIALEATSISSIRHFADQVKEATKPILNKKDDACAIYEIFDTNKTKLIDCESGSCNILTGLYEFDDRFGGLSPGSLVVLGARPSVGKSSLALDMALHAAKCFNYVVYFTFEMPKLEMTHRVLSKETKIPLVKFRNNVKRSDFEREKIRMFKNSPPYPLFIVDRNCTPDDIRYEMDKIVAKTKCERAKDKYNTYIGEAGIDLVVIDYIGLMGSIDSSKFQRRDLQIGAYTSALKSLAISRNCCVLVVSQLNRNIEDRTVRKPRLSDLRESGSLEQDADMVLFLDREESEATLTVAKNRNGPVGEMALSFSPEIATFRNSTTMEER